MISVLRSKQFILSSFINFHSVNSIMASTSDKTVTNVMQDKEIAYATIVANPARYIKETLDLSESPVTSSDDEGFVGNDPTVNPRLDRHLQRRSKREEREKMRVKIADAMATMQEDPVDMSNVKLEKVKTAAGLVAKMEFTPEELAHASSTLALKQVLPRKHHGKQRKAGIVTKPDSHPYHKITTTFQSHRMKDFVSQYNTFKFGVDSAKPIIANNSWMTLAQVYNFYQQIDFAQKEEVHLAEPSFGYHLFTVNSQLAPRLHHNVRDLPNFDIHYKNFKSISDYWQLYMNIHTLENDHHPEFWTHKHPTETMSHEATVHLLVDLFCSALRIKVTAYDALVTMMTWLYDLDKENFPVSKPKFAMLCPVSTALFIITLKRAGLFVTKARNKLAFIHEQSKRLRNKVYPYEYRKKLMSIINAPADMFTARTISTQLMQEKDSPFKQMLVEIQIHISAVETLCDKMFRIQIHHDHDKVNSFMTAALCMQFLKFEPQPDPIHHATVSRHPPSEFEHIACRDMFDDYIDHQSAAGWQIIRRMVRDGFAKIDKDYATSLDDPSDPDNTLKKIHEDYVAMQELVEDDFLPIALLREYNMYNDTLLKDVKRTTDNQMYNTLNSASSLVDTLRSKITGIDANGVNELVQTLKATLPVYDTIIKQQANSMDKALYATRSTADSMNNLVKGIDAETIMSSLTSFTDDFSGLTTLIKSTLEKINFYIPDFTKPFGFSIDSLLDLKFGDVSAIVILYYLYKHATGDIKNLYLLAILYKLGIITQVIKGIKYMMSILLTEEVVSGSHSTTDSSEKHNATFGLCDPVKWLVDYIGNNKSMAITVVAMTLIAGFVGHHHFAQMKSPKAFNNDFVRTMKDYNSIANGFSGLGKMFSYVMTGSMVALSTINKLIFGKDFKTVEEARMQELTDWMQHVHFLSTDIGAQAIASSQTIRDNAKKLMPAGETFSRHCIEGKLPRHLMAPISSTLAQAKKIYNTCTTLSVKGSMRITPTVVQYVGESGLGKSYIQNLLCERFYVKYYPSSIDKHVYPIKANQGKEFWDGYTTDTKVCVIDDVNAIDDVDQVSLFITLVSSAPVVLPMAHLHEKGKFFSSELIVCSTNSPCPALSSVNYPQAYFNRFHISVKTEKNPAFEKAFDLNGRFSMNLFKSHYPGFDASKFPHLEFSLCTYLNGQAQDFVCADGRQTQKLNYEDHMSALEFEIENRRKNDPYFNMPAHKSVADAERVEYIKLIAQLSQEYEERGVYNRLIESVRDSLCFNTTSITSNPAFTQLPPEFDKWLDDEDHETTSFMDETTMRELHKRMVNQSRYQTQSVKGEFIFNLTPELSKNLTVLTGTDPSLVDINTALSFNSSYPNIAFPFKYYKIIKSYSELAEIQRFKVFVTQEDLQKNAVVAHVTNRSEYEILASPQFRAAIWRLFNAPMEERINFIKNELRAKSAVRSFRSQLALAWRASKQFVSNILSGIRDVAKAFYNWIVDNWKINLTLIAASGAVLFVLHRVGRLLVGPEKHKGTAAYNTLHPHSPLTSAIVGARASSYIEGNVVHSHVADEADAIGRNTILLKDDSRGTHWQAVGIEGQFLAMNYHPIYAFMNSTEVSEIHLSMYRFPNYITPIPVVIRKKDIHRIRDQDLVVFKLREISSFPSIKSKIPRKDDKEPQPYTTTTHYYIKPGPQSILRCQTANVQELVRNKRITTTLNQTYLEDACLITSKPSIDGSSGGPVISLSNQSPRRFLGLQSTVYKDKSYITTLYLEDYNNVVTGLENITQEGPFAVVHAATDSRPPRSAAQLDPQVMVLGRVPSEFVVGSPPNTTYKKSPIADKGEITSAKEPAILSIHDIRAQGVDPLARAISKEYTTGDYKRLPDNFVSRAVSNIASDLRNRSFKYPKSKLSILDAIRGRQEYIGYAPIPLKTSPGIPLMFKKGTQPGKKSFISYDELNGEVTFIDPILVEEINYIDDNIQKGHIPANSLYAFPKDEVLPKEKIVDKKTRAIICSNLPWTILYRIYNSDFEAALHRVGMSGMSPFTPGINADSQAWHTMANCLLSKNTHGFDFDVSAWDKRFTPQLADAVTTIINKFYNDGNKIQRKCISHNAIFGYIQFGDAVLAPFRGNPSGFAGTTTYNTAGHLIVIFCFFCEACVENGFPQYANWSHFMALVCVRLYGDDVIITIVKELMPWFNGKSITLLYRKYGWDVTMASGKKAINLDDPIMLSGKPIQQLQFLQRGFHTDRDIPFMTASLNVDSIYDLAYWIKKTDQPRTLFYENLQTSLFYIAAHGRALYDLWLKKVNYALELIHYPVVDWLSLIHI